MNNNSLKGKKLLILGGAPNEIPIVKRAHELDVYVIVSDMYLDHNVSPAKDVADEYWDISWSDIESLKKQCIENDVDGVMGGFSEIKVESLIELCRALNLPCYINSRQLEITRDKALFKQECRKYGVPVIHEYDSVDDVNRFPVIVKPVDRAGSIGIGIANDGEELLKAYDYAMEKSLKKEVIIEDYITGAMEMDVHYAVVDGRIYLLTTDDIIPASANVKDGKVIQSAWLYPDRYEDRFLETTDCFLRNMISGMKIENGTIFFSGFVNRAGEFAFFECGFRLWGEQEFAYDNLKGPMNYLDVYIYHALTGSSHGVEIHLDRNPKLKGIEINMYSTTGIVERIGGMNEIEKMEDSYLAIQYSYVGKDCDCTRAISPKHAIFGFANENPTKLRSDVDFLYNTYRVEDKLGNSMIYDKIDTSLIEEWWDRE